MNKSKTWLEEDIIKALSSNGASREKATELLMDDYIHYLPSVVKKTGLPREEALDAFTDAIMDLIDQVVNGQFKGESKLSSYFYRIFYFKCVDLFRKNSTNPIDYPEELPEMRDGTATAAKKIEVKEEISRLHYYLEQLGEPCRQILIDWGYWGYNMTEIAERAGLAGSTQAKDRKYKCLKKLRSLIDSSEITIRTLKK